MTTPKQQRREPANSAGSAHEKRGPGHPETRSHPLLQLQDDFADYADISAFLCNALAATIKEHQWLTPEIVSGARLCSCWLQQRTSELKAELQSVGRHYDKNGKDER